MEVLRIMRVLSLFDGICCGHLALERAGIKIDSYDAYEIEKNAIKATETNFPDVVQHGDVTKEDFTKYKGKIDLIIGGSPCFPEDALVLCEEGLKPISRIQVGDKVITHKGRLRKVLKTGAKFSNTVMVKGAGSSGIECTPNHPFYTCNKNRVWNKEKHDYEYILTDPTWEKAENLKGKMWLNLCNFNENLSIPPFPKGKQGTRGKGKISDFKFTPAFFYFIGRWLGDGWTNIHKRKHRPDSWMKRIVVCCSHDEAGELRVSLKETGLHFSENDERTVHRFTCSSTQLYDWLTENFGRYSGGKKIPLWVYSLPVEYKQQLIMGYVDADGYINKKGNIVVASVNKALIVEFKILMGQIGFTSCLSHYKRNPTCVIEGRTVNQRDTYGCDCYSNPRSSMFVKEGYWGLVRSVEPYRESVMVYNLEVEEDNSYTVDGIVVHNCQGFSSSGKQLNFNDPRSKLFFEYVRAIKECQPKYFLLENVVMKKEWQDIISSYLGVEPIEINSSLVSAQNRRRLYWTNIPNVTLPEDKNITLEDILEDIKFPNPAAIRGRRLNKATIVGRRLDENGHRKDTDKTIPITQCLEVRATNTDKSNCLTTVDKDNVLTPLPIGRHPDAFKNNLPFRYYTTKEMCRLQTVPDDFLNMIPDSAARKALGNGWTVDVIAHIFSFLPDEYKKE